MQLIKRLKSLALAAIALAFAQTALAATFPGTPDASWDPAKGDAYYTDDSGTKYQFTTWKNLLKAVGWDADGNKKVTDSITPGGTAGDPLVVKIYNYTNYVSKLGCQIGGSGNQTLAYLSKDSYGFDYVTYEFHDCYFMREANLDDSPRGWGASSSEHLGIKIKFFDCNFGIPTDNNKTGGCRAFRCVADFAQYKNYPDFEFTRCNIRAFDGKFGAEPVIRLFGGSTCGDLVVSNCVLDCYIDADINGGKNSVGETPRMIVKDCKIDKRVNQVGWTIGASNSGFSSYDVSGFMDMSGNAMPMMFFKSGGNVEGAFENGVVLDENGDESSTGSAVLKCKYTPETQGIGYSHFEFAVPARLVYDANGGTGTYPVASEEGYDYRDTANRYFTVMPPAESDFSKNGFAVESWTTKATPETGDIRYTEGKIPNGTQGQANVVLYAQYGNTRAQTGWYTITGIHANDIAKAKDAGIAHIADYIKTIRYPWYSGIHYITNVYDRVTAAYSTAAEIVKGDHPEVSWANCGGIIDFGGGVKYTNQLQVTIFPKEGSWLLDITRDDYLLYKRTGFGENHYCLYRGSSSNDENGTNVKYAKFIFDKCNIQCNPTAVDGSKNEIPISPAGYDGVALAMRNCHANCGFFDDTPQLSISFHPVDMEYSSVIFVEENGVDNWQLYTGAWAGDFLMTNCTFEAKVRVSTMQCGLSVEAESLCDSFGGTTECVISNNTWRYVMPGYRIFSINRPWNQYIGENTYSPEGGVARPITMDVKDNDGDGVQLLTNVTLNVMGPDDKPVGDGHYAVKYYVHGHEVKFVETEDESKLDDPSVTKTTYYVLDGDSLDEANFWSKDNWDSKNSEKTVDLTRRNRSVPEGDWNNAVTGKSLSEDLGTTVKKDITYFLGAVTPKNPELVGTLKMSSFVKGLDPTQPSGLFWRMGEDVDLHPLALEDGEMPKYEYYIYTDKECKNPVELEGGYQATVDQLKLLEPGTYYVRGEVMDFKPYEYSGELLSAAAEFTVVDPTAYPEYMFVQWIEMTGCQCVNTKVNPSEYYKEGGVFAGEDYRKFGFWLDFEDYNPNPGNGGYGITIMGTGPWQSFVSYGNTPGLWFTDADKGTQGFGYFSYLYKTQGGVSKSLLALQYARPGSTDKSVVFNIVAK